MCTLAIVETGSGGYLLGHNRDERIDRGRAALPTVDRSGHRPFLAPTDADAGGTWIAANRSGLTVCVLNALDRHPERLPKHPTSRGAVARELADCAGLVEVRARLAALRRRLDEVRAFHLVAVEIVRRGHPPRADRHRWDGRDLRVERLVLPALCVSALLDQEGAERERGRSWRRALDGRDRLGADELAVWLADHSPEPGMLSTCVHRPDARTVSRTVVRVEPGDGVEMRYLDGPPCDPTSVESIHRIALGEVPADAQPR
jgi:hypothetical protein